MNVEQSGEEISIERIYNVLSKDAKRVVWNDVDNWIVVGVAGLEEGEIMLSEYDKVRAEWSALDESGSFGYTLSLKGVESAVTENENIGETEGLVVVNAEQSNEHSVENEHSKANNFIIIHLTDITQQFTLSKSAFSGQEASRLTAQVSSLCKNYKKVYISPSSSQVVNFACLCGENAATKEFTVLVGTVHLQDNLYSGTFRLQCFTFAEDEKTSTSKFSWKRPFSNLKQWWRVKEEENALFDQANQFIDFLSANAARVKRILPVTKTKFNWMRAISTSASLVSSKNASSSNIEAVQENEVVSC
jgi:hypothetical protein